MHTENIETEIYGKGEAQEKLAAEKVKMEKVILRSAEELLDSQANKIGFGNTAEVHFLDDNNEHCFKIISETTKHSTILKSKDRPQGQKCHPLPREARFLDELQDIHPRVRVPEPLYTIVRESVDDDDENYKQEKISIFAMERLNAVSVNDVIEGLKPMPEAFRIEVFFKELRDFFETMHRRGVHHRDAHEGNIMIDVETGLPYVIDFGLAAYGTSGDESETYREVSARGSVIVYPKDFDSIDKVERKVKAYLTSFN